MNDNLLKVLTLQKIRQIINKPYRAFGFSPSEFLLMQKVLLLEFLFFTIFEMFFGTLIYINGYIKLSLFLLIFFFFLFLTKQLQKKYGEGVIFFLLKDIRLIIKTKTTKTFKKSNQIKIISSREHYE